MRILMVSPVIGDAFGQERVIRDSTALLRQAGHEVFYLADRQVGEIPPHDGLKLVAGLSSVHTFSSPREAYRLHREAIRYAHQIQPDVVHFIDQLDWRFQTVMTGEFPVMLTSHLVATTCPSSTRLIEGAETCTKRSGWGCLLHNRTYGCLQHFKGDARRAKAIFDYRMRRKSLRGARVVAAISHYVRDLLILDGWDAEKIHHIHNPIYTTVRPVPINFTDQNLEVTPTIVCASRLERYKGIHVLLESLKRIEKLSWTALLCGDGAERGSLQALCADLGLSERVRFLGRTPYAATRDLMGASRLVVQPNIGAEPFGLSVAEASAMGVPVVATRVRAIDEIVEDGVNGLLATPSSAESLAERISAVLVDNELCQRLSEGGQRRMRELFSAESHLEKTLRAYERCRLAQESPNYVNSAGSVNQPARDAGGQLAQTGKQENYDGQGDETPRQSDSQWV